MCDMLGTVVDEGADPGLMLADDDLPEELLVRASAAVIFIRKAIGDARELVGVVPDLVDGELRPRRHLEVLRGLPFRHHDLLPHEELLQETESTIIKSREDDALRGKER